MELLLEPSDDPAVTPYKKALVEDGIPATSFQVDDVDAEYERLKGIGVSSPEAHRCRTYGLLSLIYVREPHSVGADDWRAPVIQIQNPSVDKHNSPHPPMR